MVIWTLRLLVFNLPESPVYLVSRGRDDDAVAVVHRVAKTNGKISKLTVAQLKEAELLATNSKPQSGNTKMLSSEFPSPRQLSKFYANHVMPLFATRVLRYSMGVLTLVWGKD